MSAAEVETFSVEQVATRIGKSPDWVRRRLNRREVPCLRLGRTLKLRESDVQALYARYEQLPVEPPNPWGLTATSRRRVTS